MLFLIAGLGNPGDEYREHRHNVGFWAVERLAEQSGLRWIKGPGPMLRAEGRIEDQSVLLIKPLTFMNLSGQALRQAGTEAGLDFDEDGSRILVLHDDLDLSLGRLQLRRGGGDGGHRGIRSIIAELGSGKFARVRMGVGRPTLEGETVEHVLSGFAEEDLPHAEAMAQRAAEVTRVWLRDGLTVAMNRFNAWTKPKPKKETPSTDVGEESDAAN